MKHTLTLHKDEGYIEIKLVGEISVSDTDTVGKTLLQMANEMDEESGQVRILTDFTEEVGADTIAIRLAKYIPLSLENEKVAMFGANERVLQELETLLSAGNNGGEYKMFASREEAVSWLLS